MTPNAVRPKLVAVRDTPERWPREPLYYLVLRKGILTQLGIIQANSCSIRESFLKPGSSRHGTKRIIRMLGA
jgi:hypothetical protein